LAGPEMNPQVPEVMSKLPVPIRERIVAGVSLPPVANGVFLKRKEGGQQRQLWLVKLETKYK